MKYQPRLPLWPAQRQALARMAGREAFALSMAMRTGKTPTVLAEFGQLEIDRKAKDLFVIAPGGAYRVWASTMEEHLSEDLKGRITIHVWQSGSSAGEKRAREALLKTDGPRALLMNVEALSRVGDAREFCRKFLSRGSNYVVIDESVVIKNSSKRSKFINLVIAPLAERRRILSGLMTPRSPLDLYYQYAFLDWRILGHRSWYSFRNSIAHLRQQWFGGRQVTLIDDRQGSNGFRPEAIARLTKTIDPHSFRVEFVPNVKPVYSIRDVEMTKDQRRIYEDIRDFATAKLEETKHVTATVVIAQIMRMHQVICGHVVDEGGAIHQIPENKTGQLMELLDDYSGKAIIWFTYLVDLHWTMAAIEKEYGPGSTAKFSGGNFKERELGETRFKTDPRCRFMGATAGAGGRGRAWHVANLVVYHSSMNDLDKRDQSEQRANHNDKADGVEYVDLICRGTVEEKILHALRRKINMSSAINGSSWREWLI